MYIKRLRLNNFKRFALRGIKDYEFIPETNLTIFTWKNGEGKSSIVQQLNPIPNDFNKDFFQDGFKELEFTHNGKHYLIKESKNFYSILENGIELNDSNKKKMQEDIVYNLFGYNSKVLSVINGYTLLTRMSPSERKYWFSCITNIDYTYPTKIYATLMEKRRDIIAWKKLAYEKNMELQKLLSDDMNIKDIEDLNNYIKDVIVSILKNNKDILSINLEDIEDRLINFTRLVNKLKPTITNKTSEELTEEINKAKTYYLLTNEKIKQINKEYDDLFKNSTIDKDEKVKLEERQLKLVSDINVIVDSNVNYNNITHYKEDILNLLKRSKDLCNRYNDVRNKLMEVKDVKEFKEEDKTRLDKLNTVLKSLRMIKEEYTNATNFKFLKCDKCNSVMNFDNKLLETDKKIEEIEKELSTLNILYTEYVKYNNIKKEEENINIEIKEIINYIVGRCYRVDTNITDINSLYDNISIFYNNLIKVEQMLDELNKIKERLKEIKDFVPMEKDELLNTKNKLLKDLEELTALSVKYNDIYIKLSNDKKELELFTSYRNSIKEELEKVKLCRDNELNKIYNEYSNKTVEILQEKSIYLTELINRNRVFLANIEQNKKSLEEYDLQLKDYNVLIDVLSPTSGLIAKSINSLITTVVNEMNIIINSVWNYKMKILPCDLSEGDLDYKFKVEVNDDFIIEDISKLSSSMQEIVDLSFRLVFIRFSKIGEVPIILDEFGRTMDREHRINAFNLIDNIICKNFEQVFLVSHFEEMFGRFKNASFPILEEKI